MAINLSESARLKVKELLGSETSTKFLRIGVLGSGCSGMKYDIRIDDILDPKDKAFDFDDVKVVVDFKSYLFVNGMTLDYESGIMQSGFKFLNPNAKSTCGCGESFSTTL